VNPPVFGPDEHRAVEGIAALIDLMGRLPGEGDGDLARRMADWGIQQGPEVRWSAMANCALVMVRSQAQGIHYPHLAQVGLDALHAYNDSLRERRD
jgi:hypothetical protein